MTFAHLKMNIRTLIETDQPTTLLKNMEVPLNFWSLPLAFTQKRKVKLKAQQSKSPCEGGK